MMNSSFQLEDPAASLALEQALAFADSCDIGSDEEMREGDQELDALLSGVPTDHLFAPDELLMPMPDALKLQPPVPQQQQLQMPMQLQPMGEFTGLMMGGESESDTSLEGALAVLTTHCDASASDGSSGDDAERPQAGTIATTTSDVVHRARTPKKVKRPRAPSPTRTAKDFAAANAAMAAANGVPQSSKPVKKRVRRQREELLYLRVKVKEMESSLAELKTRETRSRTPPGSSTQLACNGKPNSEGASLLASVWESLANRQYKDRERAEQENRKLKSTLEGQIKLAKCLEQILEDQPDGDMLSGPLRPESKLLSMPVNSDPKAIHEQLLSELDAAFHDVDIKYDPKKYAEIEKEKMEVKVASSLENGIALHFTGFKRVPFAQEVASRGIWRFTSNEATKHQAYFYEEHKTSSKHTVARTFGMKIQSDRGSLDYRSEGVLECRKRGERVVIVTRGLAKPIKFSAAPVNGIRFQENGWLVIEKAAAQDGSSKGKWSTIASSMELTPIFEDDALDQDFTVGALTDFVIDSFHRNMHLGEEVVAGIMLEEARKAALQPASSWL